MAKLSSSSRLKVNRDTYFLPDPEGGVYFRNNQISFRMEGSTIYQWIEKLMPMFDGERTMDEITISLTEPYCKRVYEIGEILVENRFVRDQSLDRPHQLSKQVLHHYRSQIEFIDNFLDSGAHRFQQYRQSKVLVIGSGSFLTAMVSSLLESGLSEFHVMTTDPSSTSIERIDQLVQNAKKEDDEAEIGEISSVKGQGSKGWIEAVSLYDWILYVSENGDISEIRQLNQICKNEKKSFLPAVCLESVGIAGPVVDSKAEGCWESAWRRLHQTALQGVSKSKVASTTAKSLLANAAVFEFFKKVTGVSQETSRNQIYLLDLETLEGDWISYYTHPLVTTSNISPLVVDDFEKRLNQESDRLEPPGSLFEFFSRAASVETGIFHIWDEQDLKQLPLSQCMIQAVNPLSEGPADLLPKVVCAGLTHEAAKREAGLIGIEMYTSKLIESSFLRVKDKSLPSSLGIGTGETFAEGVCRGLQNFLEKKLKKRETGQLYRVKLGPVDDPQCQFFLQSLTVLNGVPSISLQEDLFGFPVVQVHYINRWYAKPGLNLTLALRATLKEALMEAQNETDFTKRQAMGPAVLLKRDEELEIPSCEKIAPLEIVKTSEMVLKHQKKQLVVYDLTFDPFIKQQMSGVYGVWLQEGET